MGRGAVLAKTVSRAARLPLFLWSLWRFDVFVFGSGDSFFRLHDLPLLKRLGKRVVMVFHGSDLRPPYMDGPTMGRGMGRSISDCADLAARQKQRARRIERYADVVLSHPLYSHFLERPYVRALAIGLPLAAVPAYVAPTSETHERIRILHSPSDPGAKGTQRIRDAVNQLLTEGLQIEFVEVSGQPNAVVLKELQIADLVVDQLYSDTPMAGFAAEAASFGRPAIVGSCSWEEIRRTIPASDTGPVWTCDADHVAEAIRQLATDREARQELGERARAFVVSRCHPSVVAQRFLQIIEGSVPRDWVCDPTDTRHLCGAGLPPERVQFLVREIVREFGREALQLVDKPRLESELVEWAFSSRGGGLLSDHASTQRGDSAALSRMEE